MVFPTGASAGVLQAKAVPQGADLVHAPLSRWAQEHSDRIAVRSGDCTLSFAQLHAAVQLRCQALQQLRASAVVWVDDQLDLSARIVEFLAIIASGRCAAVGDTEWPVPVKAAVHACMDSQLTDMPPPQGDTPFYIGFTSGSTGMPKGYRRHHRSWTESFRICLDTFGPEASGCILAPGRDSHSLFLFGMMLGVWSGGGVVVQEKFSALQCLETLRGGRTPCLVAVPSQLLLMLELAEHRKMAAMPAVRLIMVSGARWNRSRTPALHALFPQARVVEFYGASETSFVAWMDASDNAPANAVGKPFSNVEIDIRPRPAGLIYVRSPMLFMDYVGSGTQSPEGTVALRDAAWLSVRDVGTVDEHGWLCLEGRESRMIVTSGKNLFPEELEAVLEVHPAVAQASVHGLQDSLRGLQVVAVLRLRDAALSAAPTAMQLTAHCRARLEGFKAPRRYWALEAWPQTPSGKTDHRAIAQALQTQPDGTLCLQILR